MAFQVIFNERNIASPVMEDSCRKDYLNALDNAGVKYTVFDRNEKLWHCAKVVFDVQLIESARKAIAEDKPMYGLYTFGDPNEIAEKDKVVKVECLDSQDKITKRIRNAYVVDVWKATAAQIISFKKSINVEHLSPVVGKV
jgi:hypothetical protein